MDADELVEKYREHLCAIHRAAKTIHTQVARSRRFMAFAGSRGARHPADVTTAAILDYQKHLAGELNAYGRANSVSVQNQCLAAVAGFFGYLRQAEYIAHDPARDIEYARTPKRLPKGILTLAETRKLLQQPDVNTVIGYRDRVILEVLYSTGIRRNEFLGLTLDDVDLEAGFLMIRQGKGGKDRVVPLGRIAAKYLETYVRGIRPELAGRGDEPATRALVVSERGRVMGRNTLAELLEKYAKRAGLKIRVTPHTFRHTCATHMIRNRAGIRHVQEMLGHSNLNSTQKYLQLTITDLKEAHSRFHPREKVR